MKGETAVHIAVRKFLRENGWTLIAGQYPGGSDDELSALYIVDPLLARDESPDHRRHSLGKFVPDVVAIKGDRVLIVEAKPTYSEADKLKLDSLLTEHLVDLRRDFTNFLKRNHAHLLLPTSYNPIACLAFFNSSKKFPIDDSFVYLLVEDIDTVVWLSNKEAM